MYPELMLFISLDISYSYNFAAFESFIKEEKLLDCITVNEQNQFSKTLSSFLTFEELSQKKEHFLSLIRRIFPLKKIREEDILLQLHG